MDLAAARSHVVQFKDISQANEAALESLNGTYDEFKASTEAQIARHEVRPLLHLRCYPLMFRDTV